MCEEMFGGDMDVVEVFDELDNEKSQARQHRDWLHDLHNRDMQKLRKVVTTLEKMETISETKKNKETLKRDQKGVCPTGGGKGLNTTFGGPHQDRVGILQGAQEN